MLEVLNFTSDEVSTGNCSQSLALSWLTFQKQTLKNTTTPTYSLSMATIIKTKNSKCW